MSWPTMSYIRPCMLWPTMAVRQCQNNVIHDISTESLTVWGSQTAVSEWLLVGRVIATGVYPSGARLPVLWIWIMTAPTSGPSTNCSNHSNKKTKRKLWKCEMPLSITDNAAVPLPLIHAKIPENYILNDFQFLGCFSWSNYPLHITIRFLNS